MKRKNVKTKKKEEINFFSLPSTKISIIYYLISTAILIVVALVLPSVLNYPPYSINTAFDVQMSGISYIAQYTCIDIAAILIIYPTMKLLFKKIDEWYKDKGNIKYNNPKHMNEIRKKCLNLPFQVYFVELIVPAVVALIFLSITGSHETAMISKIAVLLISFTSLFAVSSYIFTKNLFKQLLAETYKEGAVIGTRINLGAKILMQILPVCIAGMLVVGVVGYTKSIKSTEDTLFKVYNKSLQETFDKNELYSFARIKNLLSKVHLYTDSDKTSIFILSENKDVEVVHGDKPSNFVIEYTLQLSEKNNGKTYDSYAVDTQGATIKLQTKDGYYYACILYHIDATETLSFLVVTVILLILLMIAILLIFVHSLTKEISTISDNLGRISDTEELDNFTSLPIVSNDEIGDLCKAYNNIQQLNQDNLQTIKNSQELLVEKERLASLGQMIGGIAHNLKTPIMSIAGASEGLSDLTKELILSIGNPQVNQEDYKAIAADMNEWIEKIKIHTSYMSDVITAVKGQAVVFSEEQVYPFNMSTLFKQVEILMRHELKNSITKLSIIDQTTENDLIYGNINSLVQILNNMISNAIQAYGKTEKEMQIDLKAIVKDKNIIISVHDFGPGLPEHVKNKLFKEMITTKGKDGTGLGLFMSYSNIRAHFHGNITFDTSEKGTTFFITLPIYKK